MSIYDKASLVLIPSGTKTSKVYSQKPVNGDGDFTFSRSTAATRVNADGNIEKETQNLLVQSNSFTTGWGLSNVTMTSGQAGYDGTNDAWLMTDTNSGGYGIVDRLVTTGGITTFSCYAKSGTTDIFGLRPIGGSSPYVFFDLSNGTFESAGDTANLIDWDIQDAGSGWYRCSVTTSATATQVLIYIATTGGNLSPSGSTIYIQDAQVEQGLVARDYIETTTAAVEGGITDNVPRLDYTDSSCPALLLEPQRTNVCPNSEDVSNWNLAFATATANDTISPEGVQNAAKIVTSSAGCDVKLTSIPVSASTTYTATFYCKLTSGSGLLTRFYDNTNGANIEFYDYSSQLVVGEWKRVTRTFTTPVGCNNIQIWFLAASSSASVTAHYWGYQLEQGSYATSYIPTYGTSVTRNADACTKTGISSLIGQTEGVVYFEWDYQNVGSSGGNIIMSLAGASLQELYFWVKTDGTYVYDVYDSTKQAGITGTIGSFGIKKIALAYKNNDFALYINGVLVGSDTSGSVPTLTDVYIGRYAINTNYNIASGINQALLFKTRLSNEELAALTTI